MSLAVGQVALIYALIRVGDLKPSAGRYLLDAVMAAWIAVQGVVDHAKAEKAIRLERISQRGDLS
jgi:hypothetical protein